MCTLEIFEDRDGNVVYVRVFADQAGLAALLRGLRGTRIRLVLFLIRPKAASASQPRRAGVRSADGARVPRRNLRRRAVAPRVRVDRLRHLRREWYAWRAAGPAPSGNASAGPVKPGKE
jgi:hypothetical protein